LDENVPGIQPQYHTQILLFTLFFGGDKRAEPQQEKKNSEVTVVIKNTPDKSLNKSMLHWIGELGI